MKRSCFHDEIIIQINKIHNRETYFTEHHLPSECDEHKKRNNTYETRHPNCYSKCLVLLQLWTYHICILHIYIYYSVKIEIQYRYYRLSKNRYIESLQYRAAACICRGAVWYGSVRVQKPKDTPQIIQISKTAHS